MLDRFKNKFTTIIGAAIMTGAGVLYVIGKYNADFNVSVLELATLTALGWVFLTAKDTLIEGVFLNFFKVGK